MRPTVEACSTVPGVVYPEYSTRSMLDRRTNNHNPIAREWNEHLITLSLELNVNADALRELELVSYARSTRYTVMSDAVGSFLNVLST